MDSVNARVKQRAQQIRVQVKDHKDWPDLVQSMRQNADKQFHKNFTETEIINALDFVFDMYDPNALVPPEDLSGDWQDNNPFWSLTTITKEGRLLTISITDSEDIDAFYNYLSRDPGKELQNERLDLTWKKLKTQRPTEHLIPKLIFFAYLQSDLNVLKQAREMLMQLREFHAIENLYKKFSYTNLFILNLRASLGISIEEILALYFIDNGKSFANILFEIVHKEELDAEKVYSFSDIESLAIDWSKMHEKAFSNFALLTNIRQLRVYAYSRQNFPDNKIKSTSLKHLEVGGRLNSLTPDISSFFRLEKFKIAQLKLKQLPAEVLHLPNLISLDASSNLFENVPEVTTTSSCLQTLNLMFNAIAHIPNSWSSLNNLRQLLLSHNKLKEIPTFIEKLNNLEKLVIGNNKIGVLPSWIANLKALTELYCSANTITNIPDDFMNLKQLKILDLRLNPIPESQISMLRRRLPDTAILS